MVRIIRFIEALTGSRRARSVALAAAILGAVALAGCGAASSTGSAGAATSVLTKSFSTGPKVSSGNLQLALTLTPQGSSILSTPISLSVSGPFERGAAGTPPQFDLAATLSAIGQNLSFGLISTGSDAYATLEGTAYQLPASVGAMLGSSSVISGSCCTSSSSWSVGASSGSSGASSSSASSSGASSGSPLASELSKLGLNPLSWLVDPTVVGTEMVDSTSTTHVHAGIDVKAMVTSLIAAFQKSSGHSGALPSSASGLITKIESAIQDPTLDTWTGASDKILRKVELALTVSLAGLKLPSIFSGLSAVHVDLTVKINDLNQPQTITAPSNPKPFSAFLTQVKSLLAQLSSIPGLSGILPQIQSGPRRGTSRTPATGTSVSPGTPASRVKRYSRCVKRAGTDAAKLQKCQKLLGTG